LLVKTTTSLQGVPAFAEWTVTILARVALSRTSSCFLTAQLTSAKLLGVVFWDVK